MVIIDGDAHPLKALPVGVGARLAVVMGYYNRADQQAAFFELFPQPEDIYVVGDAQVAADFVLLYVRRAYDDHYFRLGRELHKHAQLIVGAEAGKDAACMIVVEKFTSELKIQFVPEPGNPLLDMFRLNFEIFLAVESVFHTDYKYTEK